MFSRAIGDETRIYQSQSQGERYSRRTEQRTGRPLTSIDELRRRRSPVLLYANAPPAQLQMRRWDQVPAWRQQVLNRP
ncbi:MAG: hypothetical protein DLM66_08255 [Candidatus Dormiibacter spiritus]|nr:MAG: hypothetical protein DLM66_08255 [Candidatus Dormibacteraeota bacterium]